MGFHPLEWLVLIGVVLVIFGPKHLQSISHNAGRGLSHAKEMKDKLMSELPVEEISKINETLSKIPTSPQQVAQKVIQAALTPDEKKADPETEEAAGPAQEAR